MSDFFDKESTKKFYRYERSGLIIYDRLPKFLRLFFALACLGLSSISVVRIAHHQLDSWMALTIWTLFAIVCLNLRVRITIDSGAKCIYREIGVRPFSRITEIPFSDIQSFVLDATELDVPKQGNTRNYTVRIQWNLNNEFSHTIIDGTDFDTVLLEAEQDAARVGVPVTLSDKVQDYDELPLRYRGRDSDAIRDEPSVIDAG